MRASCGEDRHRVSPSSISSIAAVLKSLAPIGNKLTPMLAISMQGLLFSIGTLLFGHSTCGRLVGGILSSLWAFVQPILLYGIIFGKSGEKALLLGLQELSRSAPITEKMLIYGFAGIVLLKILLVIGMAIVIPKLSPSWISRYSMRMSRFLASTQVPSNNRGAVRGALKQLFKPLFLFSVGLSALLLFFAEGSYTGLIRHLLQPLAIAFLLFFLIRLLPLEKLAEHLGKERRGAWREAFRVALDRVRNF
jgi:hypothetical protein